MTGIHIHKTTDAFLPRLLDRVNERLPTFLRWNILRKTLIVRAAMPPMPIDTDRKPEPLLEVLRLLQDIIRPASVPYPESSI